MYINENCPQGQVLPVKLSKGFNNNNNIYIILFINRSSIKVTKTCNPSTVVQSLILNNCCDNYCTGTDLNKENN